VTVEHELPILSYDDAIAFMGSAELFLEIAAMLLEELDEQMEKIHSCFAAGDLLETSRTAHRLKGNFGVVAAHESQAAAKALEHIARKGDAAGSEAALAVLDAAVERAVPVIKRHIAQAAG
jgi:HPt (histidine-containing phosphotransfer) domain-containing protein